MDALLKNKEHELMHEITLIALNHATAAMSQALKDDTFLKVFEEYPTFQLKDGEANTHQYYALHTEMQGDFSADTYMLIDGQNEEKVCQKLLPPNLLGQWEMREASLLELDNMLIAALVTIYSNLLKVQVYGHVPSLAKKTEEEIIKKLQKLSSESAYSFRAKFVAFHTRTELEILCVFKKNILPKIQSFNNKASENKSDGKENVVKGFFRKLFH
jgi:chemotaxis protein CheY-P-specific phosphatase CheC